MAISLISSTNGTATATSGTVTLPTYLTTDYIVLFIASNNGNAQTYSTNVTATAISNAGNRLIAVRIVPQDGAQTSFTFTVSTSSAFQWYCVTYRGVDTAAAVSAANNQIGNSTSSTIAIPSTQLNGYISTGNEVALSAGSVNATATWTTNASTIYSTTTGNAGMMVLQNTVPAGELTQTYASIDRGLNGTSRNQNSLSLVLQPTANNAQVNLLANPSFEAGTTIATSWQDEHSSVGTAQYTLVTSPLTDGSKAQNIQYAGQSTDTTASKVEIFQAPVTGMSPGDTLTFSLYASGTITGTYAFIGIEGFLSGGTYIDETDANLTGLTTTPQLYTVSYICKANNNYVAVYLQVPTLVSGTSFSITIDKATLTKTVVGPTTPTYQAAINSKFFFMV